MYLQRLRESLPRTLDDIREAAASAGRDPGAVTLVAVTKGHPVEAVEAALELGLRDLGENRVQELRDKAEVMAGSGVRWHMIGHLQSRKAPAVVGVAHLVHSVDRVSLAEKLGRASREAGATTRVLVQVNTSGEDTKGGFTYPSAVEDILEVAGTPGLRVEGLMTMAPFVDDEAVLRGTFRRLRETLEEARRHAPELGQELSMGMSNDLRFAVEEGSTMVRIGTALFGPRGSDPAG